MLAAANVCPSAGLPRRKGNSVLLETGLDQTDFLGMFLCVCQSSTCSSAASVTAVTLEEMIHSVIETMRPNGPLYLNVRQVTAPHQSSTDHVT